MISNIRKNKKRKHSDNEEDDSFSSFFDSEGSDVNVKRKKKRNGKEPGKMKGSKSKWRRIMVNSDSEKEKNQKEAARLAMINVQLFHFRIVYNFVEICKLPVEF